MNIRISSIVFSASVVLLCSVSAAAFADGMPFEENKPAPILTPLDKALNDIPATKEQPTTLTPPPAAAPAPEQKAEEAPKTDALPPVPESRVVEVQPNTAFFGLSVGMYDPFSHGQQATSFNLEYQPGVKIAGVLQPLFGALVTTNGSMLGYGGIGVPFNITDHVFMMPSVAVGAYHGGGGVDLDRTLAFRVGSELAYQFDDKSRLGLNMHVITNGTSTSRHDRTEVIGLAYTVPFVGSVKPVINTSGLAPAPEIQPAAGTAALPPLQQPSPLLTQQTHE